jgi:hypothetical protein
MPSASMILTYQDIKMSDEVKIISIEDHEDGSATLQVECDPETFMAIFNVGFVTLVKAGLESERSEDVRSRD